MPEIPEPELHVITFPAGVGDELRARAERHRAEARARYLAHLSQHLNEADAALALDALTVWNDVTSGDRCACACHPRLADGDLHDYGCRCRCRQTAEDAPPATGRVDRRPNGGEDLIAGRVVRFLNSLDAVPCANRPDHGGDIDAGTGEAGLAESDTWVHRDPWVDLRCHRPLRPAAQRGEPAA